MAPIGRSMVGMGPPLPLAFPLQHLWRFHAVGTRSRGFLRGVFGGGSAGPRSSRPRPPRRPAFDEFANAILRVLALARALKASKIPLNSPRRLRPEGVVRRRVRVVLHEVRELSAG